MNLNQWLEKIEAFHPNEIDLGLDRMRLLANELNLLGSSAKVITVGGTNGKGSTVATLESLALDANLSVGCYTSPHLLRFNERIRIDGSDVDDQRLIKAFEQIEEARSRLSSTNNSPVSVTFFEFTTLAALIIFKASDLDLMVLEVGLGGRLDAVNLLEPDAAIITTIALDHQSWLGDDLESIAYEKSGIMRAHSHNLVGDRVSYELISKARSALSDNLLLTNTRVDHQVSQLIDSPKFNPNHLLKQNLAIAFSAFYKLFNVSYDNNRVKKIIKEIRLKGRFQRISNSPTIIVDVAHNEQAGRNLSLQLDTIKCAGKRIAICGMMADKSIASFLAAMDSVIDQWIFINLPTNRAASALGLLEIAKTTLNKTNSISTSNIKDLLSSPRNQFSRDDQIVVTGSFITIAEAIRLIEAQK